MTTRLTPSSSRCVAKACRSECGCTGLAIPARLAAFLQVRKTVFVESGQPALPRGRASRWALPSPVSGQHFAERLGQHDLPVLVPLAAANPDDLSRLAVEVGHLQVVASDTRSPAPYIVARIARWPRFFGASSSALTSSCSE
jgi:hypothetical protein